MADCRDRQHETIEQNERRQFIRSAARRRYFTVWDVFFPVLDMEMNAIGPWQSVNEGVFFRSALDKPWISLTLFTARGIEQESFESFLDYRHRPPQDSFVQRPEYERRAADNELLLLSVSPPQSIAQSKDIVMYRNWIVCNIANVVFIGGAERNSLQWSARAKKLTPRRQKTFALAKRLVGSTIPVFTVDHPDNKDILELGIPGYNPHNIQDVLEKLGARKKNASPLKVKERKVETFELDPIKFDKKEPIQLDLFN